MRKLGILGMVIALGAAGAARGGTALQPIAEQPIKAAPGRSIALHQEVDFKAGPGRIYEALLDAAQFTAFSSRPAEIHREAGGAFSLFGGHIIGRNVELIPNRRIVQAWRVVDWPEGVYSIARFELTSKGSGTRLTFDHSGFPEGLREHLAEGWESNYWTLLRKYLQE